MKRTIVSDTGPVISLEKLTNGFDFIRHLYDEIIIPPAVLDELYQHQFESGDAYLEAYGIGGFIRIVECDKITNFPHIQRLDQGEIEAISLAHQMALPLLIEETIGRQIAKTAGLRISGIAGQIVRAHREGLIDKEDCQSKLRELLDHGRINRKIFKALKSSLE